jgi:hypothetical protein
MIYFSFFADKVRKQKLEKNYYFYFIFLSSNCLSSSVRKKITQLNLSGVAIENSPTQFFIGIILVLLQTRNNKMSE